MVGRDDMSAALSFEELLTEAKRYPTEGWDFSWLGGRLEISALPWDYPALVCDLARNSPNLLDLGTGGGEWLSKLEFRPPRTVATEAWPPNRAVAARRLQPLGISVLAVEGVDDNNRQPGAGAVRPGLPFASHSFQLVHSRHESFASHEVARVLSPGGLFVTQQVGDGLYGDFRAAFGMPPVGLPAMNLKLVAEQLTAAGLRVKRCADASQFLTFADVGALAWYLRMVPWTVEGFSVDRHEGHLRRLHEACRDGPIVFTLPSFFLLAERN
jgi:SAM-dependent methyltransferase